MTAMNVGQQVRLTHHAFGWPPGTEGVIGHVVPTTLRPPGEPPIDMADYIVDIPGPDSSGPDGRYASVYVRSYELEPIDEDGAE